MRWVIDHCVGLSRAGGSRSSPGGCRATGCSHGLRGQSRKAGKHTRSLFHLVCPDRRRALRKCCARFTHKLEQGQNIIYYYPSLSYFEFVSERSLDVANNFSSCRLQNPGIIWGQIFLTGTKKQLKSQFITSTKSWSKSGWKLTKFKCCFLGLTLTERRKLRPSKPTWRVLANQFCDSMKRSGYSCGVCVYPKAIKRWGCH